MVLTHREKRALVAFILFDLLLVIVLFFLYQARAVQETEAELRELGVTIYPEPRELAGFKLADQFGNDFSNANLEGLWSLVFFGFTACPDVCPMTMAELDRFYESLDASEQDRLRIVLVTVDPERDTPASMGEYVSKFNEEFMGLSGDAAAIEKLAEKLYVTHSEPPAEHEHNTSSSVSNTGTEYLINHSAHISVIDPQGQYVAVIRLPHRARIIDQVFRRLANL